MGGKMRIGWVGLGAMGLGMARCVARAGHHIVAHTRGRPEHQALLADGGALAVELSAVVSGADVVCINVFSEEQGRHLLYGDGVLTKLTSGMMLVLHTTSNPAFARQLATDASSGIEVVDAAFSGSPQQATAGTLTIMAGGTSSAFDRVRPLLDTYGEFVRHVGATGSGMQLKLINNLLFAAQARLAAEVYRISADGGFAPEMVNDVLARCSAASRALQIVGRDGCVARNLEGMRIYLEKDIATALSSAENAGLDLGVLGKVVRNFDNA